MVRASIAVPALSSKRPSGRGQSGCAWASQRFGACVTSNNQPRGGRIRVWWVCAFLGQRPFKAYPTRDTVLFSFQNLMVFMKG
jgi:hypothetical protein